MKILHWTEAHWPHIGGAEIFTRQFVARLRDNGHDCEVLTNRTGDLPPTEVVDGTRVHRLPFSRSLESRDLTAIRDLSGQAQAITRDFDPDILHLHTSQTGAFFFLRTVKAAGRPSVYTSHDPVPHAGAPPLLKQTLGTVSQVVAVSDYMRQKLLGVASIEHKARTIHNGLNLPAKAAAPLEFTSPQLLCVGRLTENKGFDVALRSLPAILAGFPDARIVIAGDGPERPALAQLAQDLGVDEHVSFTGWVDPDEIQAFINESTIVIVPSRWEETFSLVAVQAMQLARPVVASAIGGIPEVLHHGEHGLLVEPDRPDLVAGAVLQVLGDDELAVRLGQQGLQRAHHAFSWDRCQAAYESLYLELLA